MSQHDMTIADADGATFLADLNSALPALASTSKGTAAPATVYAGQQWIDDNTPSSTIWSRYVNDGTDNIKMGEIDVTNNVVISQVGGGAAQSIASAATIDLGSVFHTSIVVTGSTGPVTSFSNTAPIGAFKHVKFSSTPTLTHNATSLILPSAANIVAAANDTLLAEHLGSGNWRVHRYTRADGTAVGGAQLKTGTFTYDTTTTGSVGVTGVGFKPKAIIFTGNNASATAAMSIGFDDVTTNRNLFDNNGGTAGSYSSAGSTSLTLFSSSGNFSQIVVASMDTDGFTYTKSKTGSPTGTATVNYLAIR